MSACGFAVGLQCQQFIAPPHDPAAAFLADAEEEAKRGTYIFYTQDYRDTKKQRVSIHGSVYGVLRDVKLNGCDLEATIQVFDLFSGLVKNQPTGELQDTTEYFIRLRITSDLGSNLGILQARPAQLAHKMHTQCNDDESCAFNWLRIRTAQPLLHERIVLNHSLTFDGQVHEILAPVSSAEAGNRLIHDLQAVADSQCR